MGGSSLPIFLMRTREKILHPDRMSGSLLVHAVLDPDRVGKPLVAKLIRAGELVELTVVGERPRREA